MASDRVESAVTDAPAWGARMRPLEGLAPRSPSPPSAGSTPARPPQTAAEYYGDNELAVDVLRSKYLAPGEVGPEQLWQRVARAVASVEADTEVWRQRFADLLWDFRFIPGGRVLHGAGRDEAKRKPTLSNCYVVPITEDSLEGIYRCLSESALVYRTGGGVGTDLSVLRPKGAPVNATVDRSPGCTAFMNLLSESTNAVSQAGRRGALMLTLRVDHPDIEDFIAIKSDAGRTRVQYANLSVLITDEFMAAVQADAPFALRWGGQVFRTVAARELWQQIIRHAHASAEPGLIFWDTMKAYHNVEYAHPLVSTNPCAEQPLAAYTACNLGSLNLTRFVSPEGEFDLAGLGAAVAVAVRFLDDVIDYNMNNHALPQIREAVASDRRVGLGVTGLADALVLLRLRYDSEAALAMVERIMQTICWQAYATSSALAAEKGSFPAFDWGGLQQSRFIQGLPGPLREQLARQGLRNATLVTMPPVGTGSIIAETSSGIEPIFCTSYTRRVKQDDGKTFADYKVYHPLVQQLFGGDEALPDWVVTAHQIDPYFRVRMQGVIQRYTDSSISSTINLPAETTVETVADIYLTAYREGLKGVTVYREGSREGILQTDDAKTKAAASTPQTVAPEAPVPVVSPPSAGPERHRPRRRPAVTRGVTERIRTGEGNIYVTINEDEHGLCEVFSAIGKAGGNAAAQSEAISRLISLALRSGVDTGEVIRELKGISGPNPVWEDGELVLSTPDAIGRALERYVQRRDPAPPPGPAPAPVDAPIAAVAAPSPRPAVEPAAVRPTLPRRDGAAVPPAGSVKGRSVITCPECGATVVHETGCLTCRHCGWSKC